MLTTVTADMEDEDVNETDTAVVLSVDGSRRDAAEEVSCHGRLRCVSNMPESKHVWEENTWWW